MPVSKASANAITPAAKGAIAIGSGTNAAGVLAVGTNNYVLTADSAETLGVKWAAAAGGGKVLQVVQGTYSTETANGSNVYADTGLTATITPSSTSSKVLVLVSQGGCGKSAGNSNNQLMLNLVRSGTQIYENYNFYTGSAVVDRNEVSIMYLDSPATTSSRTYKTQFRNGANAADVYVQLGGSNSSIILLEIGA